ncbi:MAG TPA: hypothetical protein PK904_17130 [Bacteroidales bacterium]|nr:hypothetical protein [Bacteroidales bacterium]
MKANFFCRKYPTLCINNKKTEGKTKQQETKFCKKSVIQQKLLQLFYPFGGGFNFKLFAIITQAAAFALEISFGEIFGIDDLASQK